ncbi:hypothetical protein AB4865_06305 [Capnocytophaga sp. ARDL2]|uniref:hypothetical protein n=1 Tax=Capnocytophaga sp. ARDL2 TaxID=3238809 RepID=UPI003558A467
MTTVYIQNNVTNDQYQKNVHYIQSLGLEVKNPELMEDDTDLSLEDLKRIEISKQQIK